MILKFLKRCFLACVLLATVAAGAVIGCVVLACTSPGFYKVALSEPADAADARAAMAEVERTFRSLEMFLKLDGDNYDALQALPEEAFAPKRDPNSKTEGEVLAALNTLRDSELVTRDTFTFSLTERQLNAFLSEEIGAQDKDVREPRVSLEGGLVRCGATVATPAGDLVLSLDGELSKSERTSLDFELHAARVGRLPLPAGRLLKLFAQTNPRLPRGVRLDVSGARPVLSVTAMPTRSQLQIDSVRIAGGALHMVVRRTGVAVVAAAD
ncbi:MAG: hypothetical protein AAGA92_10420 [Planctomycetota bacterium]